MPVARIMSPIEIMERILEEGPPSWRRAPDEDRMAWAPALEIYEQDNAYIVRADLPGVNKDDVQISVTGDTLTLQGERKAPEVEAECYSRCEICYGTFSRSITMPIAIDADHIDASYQNGVLEISVPKAKEAIPTRIEIKGT